LTCPCDENERLFKKHGFKEIGTSNRVESDFLPITGLDMTEKIDVNYLDTDSTRMPNDELERVDGEPYPTNQHIPIEPYGEEPSHEPYLSEYVPCDTYLPVQEMWIQEAYDDSKHPRGSKGTTKGGQFVKKGDSGSDSESDRDNDPVKPTGLTTMIQGQEVSVNARDKKNWEKHTSPAQRADPNFTTDYGTGLINKNNPVQQPPVQQPAPEPTAEPTPEPVPEPVQEPIQEPEVARNAPSSEIYDNLPQAPKDAAGMTDAAGRVQAMKDRKALFAATEEDNGKVYDMRNTVDIQERAIERQQAQIKDREGIEDENVTQGRRDNVAALEESVATLKPQIEQLEAKLINAGKYEYEEIQSYLSRRQQYVDDLARRKEGSKAWYDNQSHIVAYDRVIDTYRNGSTQGHFTGADMDAHRAQVQKEHEKESAARKAEWEEKNKAKVEADKTKRDKDSQASEDATKRLKARGYDSGDSINDLILADSSLLPSNEKAMTGNATDQKNFLKDTKSFLQDRADAFTIRTNEIMAKRGYVPTSIKNMATEANFKNNNFVEGHSMKGVVMYNGGDKKQSAIYEKQFNNAPKVGQQKITEISIHSNGAPRGTGGSRRGGITMGTWNNKGKISMFHASASARKKLERMGITKDDFNTTGDHEIAHATWTGVTDNIKLTPNSELDTAMGNFKTAVDNAYEDKEFKFDSYTDTYRRNGGTNRRGHGEDILENEVHSRLREYEQLGTLDGFSQKTFGSITISPDLEKVKEHGRKMDNIVIAYKALRMEMNAI